LGLVFLEHSGCLTVDCLRNLPADQIVAAELLAEKFIPIQSLFEAFYPYTPIVDGKDVLMNPVIGFQKGLVSDIPIILGSTANESVLFVYAYFTQPVSPLLFKAVVIGMFPTAFEKVLETYPLPEGINDTRPVLGYIATDFLFICPARRVADSLANYYGHNQTWLYLFNHVISFNQAWGPNYTFCWDTVCHASELPYVFQSAQDAGFQYTQDEITLSDSMMAYWTNLAISGSPNVGNQIPPNGLYWPAFDSSFPNMQFATPSNFIQEYFNNDRCDFWDSYGYQY